MRILHLVNYFNPSEGYQEFYLAKYQIEKGADIKVLVINRNMSKITGQQETSDEHEIPLHKIRSIVKIKGISIIHNPFSMETVLKSFSPNIIHCHNLLSSFSQEALFLKNKYQYSVVGDIITGLGSGEFSRRARIITTKTIEHFIRKWLIKRTDAFFSCCKAVEDWLIESIRLPSEKIFNIPLGADHRLFDVNPMKRSNTRKELGLSDDDVLGIYTGKLVPSKRVHDLLLASSIVLKKTTKFKLLLIGDGPSSYRNELRSIAEKKKISNNIIFLNPVHRIQLPRYYNAADVAIWPGAFSISIIEAMACGLPIIITKSGWTSHYLEYETGFTIFPGDVENLSKKLLKLISDPNTREQMGIQSRKIVHEKLNWDKISDQYLNVYERCLR